MTTSEAAAPARSSTPAQAYAFLIVGLVAMSFAAIFIRLAQEGMPSLVIAAGRLTISALVLTPFALRGHWQTLRTLRRNDFILAAVSGAVLAAHFAAWISSLEHATVLLSVTFVSTTPLWVALLEFVFLRTRLRPLVVAGLVIAIIGGILLGAGGDDTSDTSSNALLGGGLALVGAVAMAVYLVIGRKLRARLALIPYVWLVYSCAALVLLVAVAFSGLPITGYSSESYLWVLLLALAPQLIGHTSINNAVRYLPATFVSITSQTEGIGSAVLALILLSEVPTEVQVIGSAAILAGVILAIYGQQKR